MLFTTKLSTAAKPVFRHRDSPISIKTVMKRFFLPILATLLCGVSFAQDAVTDGFRYWTNSDGTKSTVKLKLVENNGREVKLAREGSDKTITYSIDKLSLADQKFIAQMANTVTVGKRAPDFVATGIDGKQFKLSEKLDGDDKNIVLLFSRGHW